MIGMNPYLLRKFIYPAYRAVKRDDVLKYLADMHRVQVMEPDEIRAFQWTKMKAVLEHAAANVPYYRRVFKKLGARPGDFKSEEDLRSFPVLRKQDIRENLEDLIADGYPRGRLCHDETGGSTGQNLFFYVDRASSEARRANNVRMNEWIDVRIGDRWAFLWGVRFRVAGTARVKAALRNWLTNTIIFSAYKMDEASVREYLARIRRFKPDVMMGYPSALAHLSQTIHEAGLESVTPGLILVSGETLYDWQRELVEETFGATVYNHYGCCEFGALARECRYRNGLHLACERVLMETVPVGRGSGDEDLKEIIMTDLDDVGMPFIRYAIEDHGALDWRPCECGLKLPRLRSMLGRAYDVVRAPNGNSLGGTFWGHMLKENVEKFQVVQDEIDRVRIAIVPDGEFGEKQRKQVLERVREACGDQMKVEFEIKADIETTRSGKHRYIISNLPKRSEERA
jgi:phenylacetate-CoA ligase